MFDIAVIGAGPAGFSAAIQARKREKTVLVIGEAGGWLSRAHSIQNYPGFIDISGAELLAKMREQAEAMAASLPVRPVFFGGYEQAERRCAVFLPDYLTPETMDPSLFLRAIHASAPFSR